MSVEGAAFLVPDLTEQVADAQAREAILGGRGVSRHTNRGPRPSAPVQGPPHDRREVLHVGRAQHREVVTEHGVVFQVR